jgi:peptide/nickel transport system ATP-binding protein
MKRLQEHRGIAFLFISHDLAVVRELCDRVAVMYAGKFVESGDAEHVIDQPSHDYTQRLVDAVPSL